MIPGIYAIVRLAVRQSIRSPREASCTHELTI
jgi:hypothetical protein